jgi:hypothetical protein
MTPRSKILGFDTFNSMGVEVGDLNDDGYFDLMVSNITSDYGFHESSFVFINSGNLEEMQENVAPFADKSEQLGLSRGGWAWDIKFGDFDNDSILEIIQTNGFIKGETNRWPEMHEVALGSEELARFPQIYPNLRVGDDVSGHERNCFFVKNGERYFDISACLKSSKLDEPTLGRGVATADVDGDGKLDFALANNWEDSYFFHNTAKNDNKFLGLHLRLPLDVDFVGDRQMTRVVPGHPVSKIKSIPAIGAQVSLRYSIDGVEQKKVGQVDGGNGHTGRRSPDLHFGLGKLKKDDKLDVDIRWRDRSGTIRQQTIRDLQMGWQTVYLYTGKTTR